MLTRDSLWRLHLPWPICGQTAELYLRAGNIPHADCWARLPLRVLVAQPLALSKDCTGDCPPAFAAGVQRRKGRHTEILGLMVQGKLSKDFYWCVVKSA